MIACDGYTAGPMDNVHNKYQYNFIAGLSMGNRSPRHKQHKFSEYTMNVRICEETSGKTGVEAFVKVLPPWQNL